MAVLPTFSPAGQPGEVGEAYNRGFDRQQSLMERADANRRANELADQRKKQFEIIQPVIQAKAQADIATAGATLTNAKMLQDLRKRAALESPAAQKQFEEAMYVPTNMPTEEFDKDGNPIPSSPDWSGVFDNLQGLRAKYNYMALLPEYKGFVDTLNEASAGAFKQGQTIAHIKSEQMLAADRNRQLNLRNAATNEARLTAAQIGADSRLAVKEAGNANRPTSEKAPTGFAALVKGFNDSLEAGNSLDAQMYWREMNPDRANLPGAPFPYAPNVNKETGEPYPAYVPKPKPVVDTPPAKVMFYPNPADIPAQEDGQATTKSAGDASASSDGKARLYVEASGGNLTFSPSVKSDEDRLQAVQQMLEDRVIDQEQAKKLLTSLGFTPKK